MGRSRRGRVNLLNLTCTTFFYFLGLIFVTELDNEEKFFQAGLEKYCRQVITLLRLYKYCWLSTCKLNVIAAGHATVIATTILYTVYCLIII